MHFNVWFINYDIVSMWSTYLRGRKHLNFIKKLKLSKNMYFAADAEMYGQQVRYNSDSV